MLTVVSSAALLLGALVLTAPLGACAKSEDKQSKADPGPPPMPKAEQVRGKIACDEWVAHLCKCAETKPELKAECDLRAARPAALKTAMDVLRSGAPARVKFKAQKNVRKMIADCIERDNKLRDTCPR